MFSTCFRSHPAGDSEHVGNLPVRMSLGYEPKDLLFPRRQAWFGRILRGHAPNVASGVIANGYLRLDNEEWIRAVAGLATR